LAATAIEPSRAKAEAHGSGDFSPPLWAGQSATLGREMGGAELAQLLAAETVEKLRTVGRLSGSTV